MSLEQSQVIESRMILLTPGCVITMQIFPNIFSLIRHLNDVILNYVFFVEIPLIQFSCLLLVCPLLYFFLPSLVVYLSSFT